MIYLDYASLTPVDPTVQEVMRKFEDYMNPSSLYLGAVVSKSALEKSRKEISSVLNCHSDEIYFTSGGTESNNIAILGLVENCLQTNLEYRNIHMVTSVIEHSSVLEVFRALQNKGVDVTYVDVGSDGVVDPKDVFDALKPNTVLVSIMMVNNEIGTIQPVSEIAKKIRHFKRHRKGKNKNKLDTNKDQLFKNNETPFFHTDACQAPLYLDLSRIKNDVDMMSFDGQKIYGPRSSGMIYKRRGDYLSPIVHGGGQESGLRSGTENVANAVGLAKAFVLAQKNQSTQGAKTTKLGGYFLSGLKKIGNVIQNGSPNKCSPGILNVKIEGIQNEFLIISLSENGIYASTKSACLKDEDGSYVLRGIGLTLAEQEQSIRFSIGKDTTKREIDDALSIIEMLVKKMRK